MVGSSCSRFGPAFHRKHRKLCEQNEAVVSKPMDFVSYRKQKRESEEFIRVLDAAEVENASSQPIAVQARQGTEVFSRTSTLFLIDARPR